MAAPSIVEIHPADSATGVPTADQIYVVFNQEVDQTTVQIIVEGPDTDRWSGPDQARLDDVERLSDDDILATPGYKGIVAGSLSFEKVSAEGDAVSAMDYTGGGAMWYTKAVFIPDEPLGAGKLFRVYILGDEESTDQILSGVSSRTVFDTVKGANMGEGTASFSGGFTSTVADRFHVRVKASGEAEDKLLFLWWRDSSPLIVRELNTKLGSQLLEDGVFVQFSGDFVMDDEFSVVVHPASRMENTYTWTFTTGSGAITTIPTDVLHEPSVPVGGFSSSTGGSTTFAVVKTTPAVRATNLNPDDISVITVQFNKDLDAATVTDETVEVWTEPVNGDFSGNNIEFSGELAKILSVDGDTLTIQIG